MKGPKLSYNAEWDRWVLAMEPISGMLDEQDQTYEMVITCAWDGESWFHYDFVCWEMGEWIGVVTREQYDARVKDITDHEGPQMADLWRMMQEQVVIVSTHHPVFALRKHFEAMMTLNLFSLSVTHREWRGKAVSPELSSEMDALREKEQRNMAEIQAADAQ